MPQQKHDLPPHLRPIDRPPQPEALPLEKLPPPPAPPPPPEMDPPRPVDPYMRQS